MGVPVMSGEWAGVAVANLGEVIPALVAAYGAVLGVVAVVTGWQWLKGRGPGGRRRGVVVPPVGVTEHDADSKGEGGLR